MKLCKDCRWYFKNMVNKLSDSECAHNDNCMLDYINGSMIPNYHTCIGLRHDPKMCGPDGKWFEPVQKAAAGQADQQVSECVSPDQRLNEGLLPAPAAAPAEPYVDAELKARYDRSHPKRYSQHENIDQMLDDPRHGQGDKER